MSQKLVIAGGSGFIGQALTRAARARGMNVTILSRSSKPESGGIKTIAWDARTVGEWKNSLEGAHAVINLAGRSVATKWTPMAKQEIESSRVESTRAIGMALDQVTDKPKVWVNASAIGFYGYSDEARKDETSAPEQPEEFLTEVCRKWEDAARSTCPAGVDLRFVRIGVVLGLGGGALPPLLQLTKLFIGGHVGSGKQGQSWIHLDDLVAQFLWMTEADRPAIINGTSPNPVDFSTLMATLRHIVGRPWAPPAPSFALQLASLFGAPEPELVTRGNYVLPKAALEAGFEFKFPNIEPALRNLVGHS